MAEREADVVGGPEAFEPFFRRWFPSVARAAAMIVGDPSAGQDLAQEAFLKLVPRWEAMRSGEHARNFVFKVALNAGRSHRRKHLRLVPSGVHHADLVVATEGTPSDAWVDLSRAMRELSHQQRACVVMVDLVGMSSDEVGEVLGISASTVRVHTVRARSALRAKLMEADGGH